MCLLAERITSDELSPPASSRKITLCSGQCSACLPEGLEPGIPIAIYSTATSSHADALRGMEFLYSLNRLNVAT